MPFDPDLFEHLKPVGTVRYTLTGLHIPRDNPNPVVLELAHAGRSNAAYINAMMKIRQADGASHGDESSAAELDTSDVRQSKAFARHVVIGWHNVVENGKPTACTPDRVEELLVMLIAAKRPDYVRGAVAFASNPDNFREERQPTAESVGKE